tara:strand:- start:7939 stop:8319 length:381 start_codon:yes stop_codon:yes gene_type:complete
MRAALNDDQKARMALDTVFSIMNAWDVSEDDEAAILGQPDREALRAWKDDRGPQVGDETILRISYVFGIFKAINILLPDNRIADEWVKRPNKAQIFGGRSALDRMTDGDIEDLKVVRQYLDAELYR